MDKYIVENRMTGISFGPYHANSKEGALDIFAKTRPYENIEIKDFEDLLEKVPRPEEAPEWGRDTFDVKKI